MDIPHRSIFAAFDRLERELAEFLNFIPLEAAHMGVWSPILASIILEAGSQLDSLWKLELRAENKANGRANIEDYFVHFGALVAKKWLVVWSDDGQKIAPFAIWNSIAVFGKVNYVPLPWWQAYNALKHDRWENRREATVENAVQAIGGLFLAIIHCSSMEAGILEHDWIASDTNREFVAKNINDDAKVNTAGASIETRTLSFAISSSTPDFESRVTTYYRCSGRFGSWLEKQYGRQIFRY